jgi:hypothetical protein
MLLLFVGSPIEGLCAWIFGEGSVRMEIPLGTLDVSQLGFLDCLAFFCWGLSYFLLRRLYRVYMDGTAFDCTLLTVAILCTVVVAPYVTFVDLQSKFMKGQVIWSDSCNAISDARIQEAWLTKTRISFGMSGSPAEHWSLYVKANNTIIMTDFRHTSYQGGFIGEITEIQGSDALIQCVNLNYTSKTYGNKFFRPDPRFFFFGTGSDYDQLSLGSTIDEICWNTLFASSHRIIKIPLLNSSATMGDLHHQATVYLATHKKYSILHNNCQMYVSNLISLVAGTVSDELQKVIQLQDFGNSWYLFILALVPPIVMNLALVTIMYVGSRYAIMRYDRDRMAKIASIIESETEERQKLETQRHELELQRQDLYKYHEQSSNFQLGLHDNIFFAKLEAIDKQISKLNVEIEDKSDLITNTRLEHKDIHDTMIRTRVQTVLGDAMMSPAYGSRIDKGYTPFRSVESA